MLQKSIHTIAIFVFYFVPLSLQAQQIPKAWTSGQVQEILKKRVETNKQAVGIVVGLVNARGSQVAGYGSLRKSEPSNKLDQNTVFEIGSASKVFTSLLLADMVNRGEVALEDPASKFLPKTVTLPTRGGREITLLDLATHTSALPRLPSNLMPADAENPYADYSVERLYDFLSKCTLTRDIGSAYEYSNLGTGLLGHILALRAGSDYETLLATRISKPLGMGSTSIAFSPDMLKRLANGHNETLTEVKNWDIPTLAGAGAIRSSLSDMLLFLEANMGKTKSPLTEAMALQQEKQRPAGSPSMSIALGWHILAKNNEEVVWHNGQTGGYHSFIGFDKKRGVGVVVLANTAADIDDIGFHLIDTRNPLKTLAQKNDRVAIAVDSKILDGYVGDYVLAPTFVISITKEKDKLMLQATAQPKFEIFAESEVKFFLKEVDAQVSFVKDNKGAVTQLILHQNGANQPAKKRK